MSLSTSAPWHKASFDRLLQERLPQLLADRLPLVGYHSEPTSDYTCNIVVTLVSSTNGDIEVEYSDIPRPDRDGLFNIDGALHLVVPTATQEELDIAEIHCVGEQLYDYIEERLGQAPPDLPWDAALARAWLPLDTWIDEFMQDCAQRLDTTNWISRRTHIRRILIPHWKKVIAPGQSGRVCPFEMPEGPNLGRVFTVAVGAEIHQGKLVIVDDRPEAGLSLSACMVPFLEHNTPNHVLMGVNMMRQSFVPPTGEPALVQTGHEPDAADFWCGRNLFTAFVSLGEDTFAEGIVISKSCAQRLSYPHPVEPGDKLSNRHGTKGVVSRILPDDEMPHLPDGTPVELVFSFGGLHLRMNFGQIREAVMGRIAHAEGAPALAPPFHAPDEEEIRQRLVQAGLPESGMEILTLGREGPPLERPSTVGWVYWNRLVHVARAKIRLWVSSQGGQKQGELENLVLRAVGAYENLAENLNTRAIRREDADSLVTRLSAGPVEQVPPPTPMFADLVQRLQVAGIQTTLENERLTFRLRPPEGDVLRLARPIPHPWLREHRLDNIGVFPSLQEYHALVEANDRLARMLASQTPEKLTQDALAQLESRVQAFFHALLQPAQLRFGERLLFSGRAVIAPSRELRLDQVGLPDEMTWTLFGPQVTRKLGDETAVKSRSERAAQVLDEVMADSWVIINRAPSFALTALLAFHPVRDPDHVVRLHPLVCEMLNADFDGDQVAVLLPVTAAAQCEAGELLSVGSHLARDPGLLPVLLPPGDALWGLSYLSLTEQGRAEIARLAGEQVTTRDGLITQATLLEAMQRVLQRDGVTTVLRALERLTRRGFKVAKASGASLSPFIGSSTERSLEPEGDVPELWASYAEELIEKVASSTVYADPEMGPQLLSAKSRGRGLHQLAWLIGSQGTVRDVQGNPVIVRHGYRQGLTPTEMYACIAGARAALARTLSEWEQLDQEARERGTPTGFNVLARARRSKRPGIVFARAAASSEVDPLLDVDSRLLVGLPALARP